MGAGFDPRARRQARRALVQALYQWQLSGDSAREIARQFEANGSLDKADGDYFFDCLRGVVNDAAALDACFEPYLDRKLDALDHVEKAILRAGTYELKARVDTPYRVVLNEYIELAKTFGAEDSHTYVNGILDRVAMELRSVERV